MFKSLRSQLLAIFFLIAVVPLAVALGLSYWSTRSLLEAELEKSLRAIAARQAAQLSRITRERMAEVELLAQSPLVIEAFGGSDAAISMLAQYARPLVQERAYSNLYLIGRDGSIIYTAQEAPESRTNLRRDFRDTELTRVFERAITILETEFSDYRIHQPTGRPAAFVATPVLAGGRILGVIALEMGPAAVLAGVDDYTGLGVTGETLVLVRDGNDAVLVSPTRQDPTTSHRLRFPMQADASRIFRNAIDGQRGSGFGSDQWGREVFATWRYLPAMRWGIVVKIDRSEAFASVDRLGMLFLGILGLVTVVMSAVAGVLASTIVRPIRQLSAATRRVASGEFAVPIEVKASREIEALASDFRGMVSHLNETFTELRATTREREKAANEALAYAEQARLARIDLEEANATLEMKVEERTRELTEKNGELERALGDLQRSQQQLIAQEKMASLGQLTSGIAHEISNPINFVTNFSELSIDLITDLEAVGQRFAPSVESSEFVEFKELLPMLADNVSKIHLHGRRAENIVKSMLEHTRATASTRQPRPLNQVIRDLVRTSYQSMRIRDAQIDVAFVLSLDESVGDVPIFSAEFTRAFNNLAYNAIWAANERRKLAGPDFLPTVEVRTRPVGDNMKLHIRDNGIGIPREHRARIFQPFFTTKPPGAGVGLGLSLAWQLIVDQHGGTIEFESEPHNFTEFVVTLPTAV
jgi:signal transduction histidine kinase